MPFEIHLAVITIIINQIADDGDICGEDDDGELRALNMAMDNN